MFVGLRAAILSASNLNPDPMIWYTQSARIVVLAIVLHNAADSENDYQINDQR